MNDAITVLWLGLATASISFTLTQTVIFEWFRDLIEAHLPSWINSLFNCAYCMSHWVGAGLVMICQPKIVDVWWCFDYTIAVFAIVSISSVFVFIIDKYIVRF